MYHQLFQRRISLSSCQLKALPLEFSTFLLWLCDCFVTSAPLRESGVGSVISSTIVNSTPAGALSTLRFTNLVLVRWSRLCCKKESTSCSAWRMVQSLIKSLLYAVSFFAICLILLFDTSSCESSSPLKRNCHGLLLGLCGFLVGVLVEEKLLIRAFFFWCALLNLCPKRAPSVLAGNMEPFYSWAVEECAFWIKTRKDALLLPDMFLNALLCLGSTGIEKCISIALSDVEGDNTIVCILFHFWPTGSPRCLWLS